MGGGTGSEEARGQDYSMWYSDDTRDCDSREVALFKRCLLNSDTGSRSRSRFLITSTRPCRRHLSPTTREAGGGEARLSVHLAEAPRLSQRGIRGVIDKNGESWLPSEPRLPRFDHLFLFLQLFEVGRALSGKDCQRAAVTAEADDFLREGHAVAAPDPVLKI